MDVGRKKLLWSFIHFNVCIGFVFFFVCACNVFISWNYGSGLGDYVLSV